MIGVILVINLLEILFNVLAHSGSQLPGWHQDVENTDQLLCLLWERGSGCSICNRL
jgi:hypothetical protein